ncbi:ExeM/NucH family extracellular endonuclease [Paraglaciecola aquimarina]|uniref:ExeM/NucH family extracellular endonuclease n=1 Tax=Paraglaciecola algarum TaxID=3050085 RepID=A0ABS9DD60_9ALTE|nr:ExeM/NucH family extracellular endonuclease [Paraglaciecola sp. G1-23]MCF2949719.1 ExeM/NucH family extracellular endonuclease [Paraglaciecola sp. G1-23]
MKFRFSTLAALMLGSSAQANDLVITGVIDGPLSGGTPKAVEIFVLNDITDLSVCGLGSANNGNGGGIQEYTFNSGAVSAGSYIYISSESVGFEAFMGFQPTDTSGAMSVNGDDAIELFCNGAVVDTFGEIDVDGTGTAWEYLDGWAYRSTNTGPDGETFVLGNWSFSGKNALDGESSNATATTGFPLKSFAEGNGNDSGDGNEEPQDGNEGSDPVNTDVISGNVCTNCPDVPKIKDLSLFDASSYYAAAQVEVDANSTAATIKLAINDIISTGHKNLTYSDVWTALTYTDEDPANTNNVTLWYSNRSQAKSTNGSGSASSNPDNWNREHSWPKSHGFSSSSLEAYTDIHHLRPTDISINSSRGNLDFDNSDNPLSESPLNRVDSDSFEPRDDIKGDVARMMFYMDTRYEGFGSDATPDLELVNRLTTTNESKLGMLCTLNAWHAADPVDDAERTRNNRIYELQGNRNPYTDNPAWVDILYPATDCNSNGGDNGEPSDGNDGDTGTGEEEPVDNGSSVTSDIIISGVIDGPLSGGIPKAVEIYVVNDIDDLSVCGVGFANNGGGSDGQEFTFNAVSASAGDFIYVASETTGFTNFFGFAPDYENSVASINGDDAIELYCAGEVVDTFGDIEVDGTGEAWEYLDGWAYRVANTGPDGSTFVLANWNFSGKNALDGTSDNDSANPAFPLGSFYVEEKLIITGVVDASLSGGTPKVIEFFAATDIQDLSVFGFGSANNGGGSDGQEYTFSGSANKGDYFYIASESTNFEAFFGFAPTDTSGAASINGDDAIELFKNGAVVDVFGDINTDGSGTAWEYLDGWASRKVNTGPDGASFNIDNWVFSGINVLDGQSTNDTATTPFPIGSFSGTGNNGGSGGEEPSADLGVCADPTTLISAIQGSGDVSPLEGQAHVVEAIVTGVYANFNGFFVQEEDADMDADSQTSEGLFVFYTGDLPSVGSVVRVKGEVEEFFDKTQLKASETLLTCGTQIASTTPLILPFSSANDIETLEGMLVTSAQELVVTNTFELARYGQTSLSSKLLFQPTNVHVPGSQQAIDLAATNALDQIILADDSSEQNPEVIPYPTGNLSATNSLRLGDTVASLTGVVDYSFGDFVILPTTEPSFVNTNQRTSAPDLNLGNLKVASLNVLNYFTTLNISGNTCGPSALGCRGAESAEEFTRQKAKTVAAIVAMDADILGLMEIENSGTNEGSAIADLVAGINAEMGAGTYAVVDTAGPVGTDAITVALIYKPAKVSLVGALGILDSSNSITDANGPLFVDTKNRPALVQKFALTENGEELVVSVNHFKSKGSGCGVGDDDLTTGQGNCNLTRTRAAQALTAFIAANFADTPTLILGDLNAYAKEDPITQIESAGYTNLVNYFGGDKAYSYSFDGQLGTLDHALANNKALAKVVDVTEWHINADEPIALDYNTNFKKANHITDYYAPDAYRMSDHDPVLIALQFDLAAILGDLDGDGDVDTLDVRLFQIGVRNGEITDLNFDFNNDGAVNTRDVRGFTGLCTRARCSTN